MSSSEDVESDKVNDLAYYTTSSSPNHTGAPAAIVLPAQTAAGWTQADLEHAAIGQFYFFWVFLTSSFCFEFENCTNATKPSERMEKQTVLYNPVP